ncbi:MAG: TetR/AcrR family transcriptional regulator [Actinomycetota bacterium]
MVTGATKVRTKKPEVRRDQLLDAAERLFGEKGYAETTVSDIADAAGVAKGTFYLYFPSKEHCVVALKERLAQGIVDRFLLVLNDAFDQFRDDPTSVDVEGIVRRLIDESFSHALEHADAFTNLFHRGETIEIDQAALAAERTIINYLTEVITQMNELGLAHVTSPSQTARILFTGVHWSLDQALCREHTRDLGELKEAAVEVATRALGGRSL